MRLSLDEFADLVDEAMKDIPGAFLEFMADVLIEIEPMPHRGLCESVGISNPRALLGLYRGIPFTERSVQQHARLPDYITIFQRNIERMCRSREQIVDQVRRTVFHEVGHHFGLDEEELARLGC